MECSLASFLLLLAIGLGIWLRAVSKRARATETRLREVEAKLDALRRSLQEEPERRGEASPQAGWPSAAEGEASGPVADMAPAAEPEEAMAPELAPEGRVDGELPTEPSGPPPAEPAAAIPPRPAPARRIDWERWLGIRGAAILGAAALALAGVLFLKFSIEQGLIPPVVRVSLGVLAGLAAIVGSEALRRRAGGYETTANALAGAGVVLIYAAVWAARALYELVPGAVAFVLMALVTAACGALSWRYASRIIASLGLIGGFATPLLLSTGVDHPVSLFGYLLLLNGGLLVLAAKRGWPGLGLLGLGLTGFYQAGWIFTRMGVDRALLGLVILGLFATVYAVSGWAVARGGGPEEEGRRSAAWRGASIGGVLLPFVFASYFAERALLGTHLVPLAALLLLLSLLALWLGRVWQQRLPGVAAAAASLAVVAVWSQGVRFDDALAWELTACALVLALAFHLVFELDVGADGRAGASLVAAAGFLLLLIFQAASLWGIAFWPWLVGWLGLAAMLWRQGVRPGLERRRLAAGLGLGLGFGIYFVIHEGIWPVLFCALAAAAVLQILALASRDAEAGAAVMPLLVLFLALPVAARSEQSSGVFPAVALGLGLLSALAATRLRSGGWYFAAMAVTAAVHLAWSYGSPDTASGLAILALATVLFTFWPFVAGPGLHREPWAWRASALAAPAWFVSLGVLFESRFGDAFIGLLPVTLGALSLAATFRARRLWPGEDAVARGRLAWFAAAALGFASVAIPLQLDKEWITLGWALEGLAVTFLWRRLNHPGLKYFGLALLAAATLRLVANPALVGYYPRGGFPVVNWLLYTYLVPAAALVGTAAVLFALEVERHRGWEERLYGRRPAGAVACSLAAIAVVFAWINLTIFDVFSTGDRMLVSFDRLPARDLTMSLAWIAYALVLLGLGMARASRGLRWISLAFLVLAIGKVFLYDLGELQDLYRVASLLGLALSLILVSLAYQRFVFGKKEEER